MNKTMIAVLATGLILCSGPAISAEQKILMIVKDGSDAAWISC